MKDAFFFKHDLNARNDPKIIPMRMKLGTEGYGAYCMIVEKLYEANGRLPRDYAALSWELHFEQGKVKQLVEGFGLFYDANGKIASKRVDREIEERAALREAGRKYAARRWGSNGKAMGTHKEPTADPMPGEDRRGEERIEDNVVRTGACGQVDNSVDKCEFYSKAEGKCNNPRAQGSKFCDHHIRKFQDRRWKPRGKLACLPQPKEMPPKEQRK